MNDHEQELRLRVKRGAALLDRLEPRWRQWVDAENLRMQGGCDCVLGQVFGSYSEGVAKLLGLCTVDEPADYGFVTRWEDYPLLDTLWREYLS